MPEDFGRNPSKQLMYKRPAYHEIVRRLGHRMESLPYMPAFQPFAIDAGRRMWSRYLGLPHMQEKNPKGVFLRNLPTRSGIPNRTF